MFWGSKEKEINQMKGARKESLASGRTLSNEWDVHR